MPESNMTIVAWNSGYRKRRGTSADMARIIDTGAAFIGMTEAADKWDQPLYDTAVNLGMVMLYGDGSVGARRSTSAYDPAQLTLESPISRVVLPRQKQGPGSGGLWVGPKTLVGGIFTDPAGVRWAIGTMHTPASQYLPKRRRLATEQVAAAVRYMAALDVDVRVLVGDFNTGAKGASLEPARRAGYVSSQQRYPVRTHRVGRIDHVIVKGGRVTGARGLVTGSDHKALVVTVALDVPSKPKPPPVVVTPPTPDPEPPKPPEEEPVTYYLETNPPRQRQYRDRRAKPTGAIVIHTAEGATDFTGEDTGAEGVARFIRDRTSYGSYHRLVDSDSIVPLVRFSKAAYGDGTGSNEWAIHVSFATRTVDWSKMSAARKEAFLRNGAKAAAEAARWLKAEYGISVPARHITRADSEAGRPGFLSHAQRDPRRRSDPGANFDWPRFLKLYAEESGQTPTTPTQSEEDEMAALLDEPINLHNPKGLTEGRNITVREVLGVIAVAAAAGELGEAAKKRLAEAQATEPGK